MGLAPRASQILGTALHCLRPCHDVLRRGTRTPVECVRRISCTRSGKPLSFRSSHIKSCEHDLQEAVKPPFRNSKNENCQWCSLFLFVFVVCWLLQVG